MDEYIIRKEAMQILEDRMVRCAGVFGDIGGAVSGARLLIAKIQATDVVPREEYAKLQEENAKLKNQVWSLKKKIKGMKSDASWEEDIRRGQVQGMW